jgi:hypothetical protein
MRLHLDALVLLQRIWGAFGAITAAALAVLAVGAEAALIASGSVSRAELGAIWLLGACAATLAIGAAGAFLVAGGLRRRRVSARFAALVLAMLNLIVVPFGTALGVYTFWVLLNNDARREFGRPPRGPSAGAVPSAG